MASSFPVSDRSAVERLSVCRLAVVQSDSLGAYRQFECRQSAPSAETVEIRMLLTAIEECQLKLKALIGQLSDWN